MLKVGDVHEHTATYPSPVDLQEHNFKFILRAINKPLISNYSHFEFSYDFIDIKTGEVIPEPSKNSWKRVIVAELRQLLIKKAKFSLDEFID